MRTASGTGFQGPGKRLAVVTDGPWKSWRRMSRHARAIKFIETYCRAPKGKGHGKPLKLATFQKHFLEEALPSRKLVEAAILGMPRGNGKSSFGGGIAVWSLFDDDETGAPQVPIIATTITQAVRSCYGVAVSMVKAEPELLGRSLIYTGISNPRITVPVNEGEMFPISNDPDGLQGLDPSLALVDEIGFQPYDSWNSLKLASGKRERSLTIGLGTPGFDRTNALWEIRKLIREGGPIPGVVFREYAAPDGCDIADRKMWRIANPALRAGFLRESALETDLRLAPAGRFRIFRLGQWFDGVEGWLGDNGRSIWDALASPWDMVEGGPTWVGVDIAIKRDTSAVVWVQERPDGRLHAKCRIWAPTPDRPVDTTDVMQFLRDLDETYDLKAVSYDPRFFDVPAKTLADEGLAMVETPQSLEKMTPAVGGLFELITHQRLTHDGDQVFAEQVLNAIPRYNERGFTLSKSKSRGKIDAAVALALAADEAVQLVPERTRSVDVDDLVISRA